MTATWSAEKIASLLREAFTPQFPKPPASRAVDYQKPPTATIDVLITFDGRGVSSHPNHISLYHGARSFISSLASTSSRSPVDMYTLTTIPFFRKYAGVLDVFSSLGATAWAAWRGAAGMANIAARAENKEHPPALLFMHGFGRGGWATAREAMTKAHLSQMVWFRYGWITLSRYMFMNDLKLERI